MFLAEQPTLLVSNRYYIRNVTFDGKHVELLAMHLNNAVALDFDYQVQLILLTPHILLRGRFSSYPMTHATAYYYIIHI